MAIKIYTENFPEKIMEKLFSNHVISQKDDILAVYVNTFLGHINDACIITPEKIIQWINKRNAVERKVLSFKKIKDITYEEKGLYGYINYHLSTKKTFVIKLNRQDGEKFYNLSRETWEKSEE
ncbi:MAG: hypothetical protein GXY91_00015 [Clostridia bacterium]|nr:hypothetical protein [Clostridia bacterium]